MGDPLVSNYTCTFNFTSTVTTKNSSAIDVSISIKLVDDSAACIWFDPNDREEYENRGSQNVLSNL